jgi:hypothetical protein
MNKERVRRKRLVRAAPFSLRNRIGPALWHSVWLLLFCSAPRPLHGWRCLLLRASGAKLGEAVNAYPWARIRAPGTWRWGIIVA